MSDREFPAGFSDEVEAGIESGRYAIAPMSIVQYREMVIRFLVGDDHEETPGLTQLWFQSAQKESARGAANMTLVGHLRWGIKQLEMIATTIRNLPDEVIVELPPAEENAEPPPPEEEPESPDPEAHGSVSSLPPVEGDFLAPPPPSTGDPVDTSEDATPTKRRAPRS